MSRLVPMASGINCWNDLRDIMRVCMMGKTYRGHDAPQSPVNLLCDDCATLYEERLDKEIAHLIELRNNVK